MSIIMFFFLSFFNILYGKEYRSGSIRTEGWDKMLNKIWCAVILASYFYALITKRVEAVTAKALEAGGECVSLMLVLLGTMSFFNGLMKAADSAGLTKKISRLLSYPLKKLFPEIPENHKAFSDMSLNISANMLGLGNAATPPGIAAMRSLADLSPGKSEASRAMCLFAVMNTSSVQLIPTTVIALRINFGSLHPFAVTLPILISSFTGLFAGIAAVCFFERRFGNASSGSPRRAHYPLRFYHNRGGGDDKKSRHLFGFFSRSQRKS